jgi:Glycosyltransferase family 87
MHRADSWGWKGRMVATIFVGLLWGVSLAALVYHRQDNQWDFQVYYYAAKAWTRTLNPYALDSLKTVGGDKDLDLQFVYPPITLSFFRLFTRLPYDVSCNIWLALNVLGLVALVGLWWRTFLKNVDGLVFLVVVLLAFNSATLWDLHSGNVTVFEQLFLWVGFWCYLRGERACFALLVVLGSVFKITLIVLLGLLLFPREVRKAGLRIFVAGLATFILLVFSPMLYHPSLGSSFLANLMNLRFDVGLADPCAFALIAFLSFHHWIVMSYLWRAILAYGAWGVYVVAVVALTFRPLLIVLKRDDRLSALVYSILVYTLITPRVMAYSYMILIVPFLLILYGLPASVPTFALLLLPICIPTRGLPVQPVAMISSYYPFFLTLGLWYVIISGRVDLGKSAQILMARNPRTQYGEE